MGRVNQAMQRARQAGVATEFQSIAVSPYDASVLSAEPFPAEGVEEATQESAAPDLPKTDAVSRPDDRELIETFFNTYHEKVWDGPTEEQARLLRLLAKVQRQRR